MPVTSNSFNFSIYKSRLFCSYINSLGNSSFNPDTWGYLSVDNAGVLLLVRGIDNQFGYVRVKAADLREFKCDGPFKRMVGLENFFPATGVAEDEKLTVSYVAGSLDIMIKVGSLVSRFPVLDLYDQYPLFLDTCYGFCQYSTYPDGPISNLGKILDRFVNSLTLKQAPLLSLSFCLMLDGTVLPLLRRAIETLSDPIFNPSGLCCFEITYEEGLKISVLGPNNECGFIHIRIGDMKDFVFFHRCCEIVSLLELKSVMSADDDVRLEISHWRGSRNLSAIRFGPSESSVLVEFLGPFPDYTRVFDSPCALGRLVESRYMDFNFKIDVYRRGEFEPDRLVNSFEIGPWKRTNYVEWQEELFEKVRSMTGERLFFCSLRQGEDAFTLKFRFWRRCLGARRLDMLSMD